MASEPWFIKYKPNRFTDLVFSNDIHIISLKWLKNAGPGSILHINGRPGTGKTCLAYLIAKTLKYNIIEYTKETKSSLKDCVSNPSGSLNHEKNLLLIDEPEIDNTHIFLNTIKNTKIPIIITSVDLILKDIETLRIEKPNFSNISAIYKLLSIKEGLKLTDQEINKTIEDCNHDIRAIINHFQLISNQKKKLNQNLGLKLNILTSTGSCRFLTSKNHNLETLQSLYTYSVARQILASHIQNSKDVHKILTAINYFSDTDIMPEDYKFIVLKPLNSIHEPYRFVKEDQFEIKKTVSPYDPLFYLPFYKRSLHNKSMLFRLQQIFSKYNIKDLTGIDLEISQYVEKNVKKTLKYKFNKGSSNAVKRDVNLYEILD